MTFAVVAPVSRVGLRPRLIKMMPVLRARGLDPVFYGWERVRGEAVDPRGGQSREHTILRGGGHNTRIARLMYPLWMLAVFLLTLRLGRRANLVCVGWETAFPALIASRLTGASIIFDDADRFSLVVKLPALFRRVVQALERWTSRRAALHLVPGLRRYDWRGDNMKILRNAPVQSDYENAKLRKVRSNRSELVVYVNGWIGETRGAPIFLELMREAGRQNLPIRMLLAGRLGGKSSSALTELSNVTYCGRLELPDALGLYRESDIALIYFDPSIEINRLAESNKWGDCVFLNVPFITNSEVETADAFFSRGAAVSVPYSDVGGLLRVLVGFIKHPSRLAECRRALRQFEKDYVPFDIAFGKLIDEFLAKAAAPRDVRSSNE